MMSQGEALKVFIEKIQEHVRNDGTPILVDGKGTIELLNNTYILYYQSPINLDSIARSMKEYYEIRGLSLDELQELEKGEYKRIYDTLISKFDYFDDDIHSRRVLWTDDCCISMVHYLIRNNTIYCYFHLRSSDIVYKLFSDLYLIHKITRRLQDKLGVYNTNIHLNAHSFHEIVIK